MRASPGRSRRRTNDRSSTGSVEASAEPRMSAAGGESLRRSHPATEIKRAGSQRTGTEHEESESPIAAHLSDVDADGIAEQHEDQGERRDHLQRWRPEIQVDQSETKRAEHETEEQKNRDLWQAGAIDPAGEQGRNENDDADQRESCREMLEHGLVRGSHKRIAQLTPTLQGRTNLWSRARYL